MKLFFKVFLFVTLFLLGSISFAQQIEIITHGLTKYEPVGTYEIVFDFEVVNISNVEQTVFEIRTINELPAGWISSMCFGELCFPPDTDTLITRPPFPEPPLQPGDTLITSVHVFTDQTTIGTAHIQLEVGTFEDPTNKYVLNFTATTDPAVSVSESENNLLNSYYLYQNYPNPFNPSTRINYNVGEPGLVQLKVYNVLGVEVATLVDAQQNSGNYTADFNAAKLSSGVYFYSLSVNNFTQTRKMILEK